jgi:hypothetical protein
MVPYVDVVTINAPLYPDTEGPTRMPSSSRSRFRPQWLSSAESRAT